MSKAAVQKPKRPAQRPGSQRYEPGIDDVRILDMRAALESDSELPRAMRHDISQALSYLNNFLLLEELRFSRMRPKGSFPTAWAVLVVGALVTECGVSIKTALHAAVPPFAVDRVRRAYSERIKKEGRVWAVDERQIEKAAAQLTKYEIERGAARLRQRRKK